MLIRCHVPAGKQDVDYSGAFLYSPVLASQFGMQAPYEQYGLYSAAVAGGAVMANSFFRAYHLAKYVDYKARPGCQEQAQFAADLAQVAPHELDRAGRTIVRLRARGITAALAFPALWVGWRLVMHTSQKTTGKRST